MCYGRCGKMPPPGGLKQQKLLSHCAGGWISKMRRWQEEFVPRDRHTYREKGLVEMKAETQVMLLPAEESQILPANHWKLVERRGTEPPSQHLEGTSHANGVTSDF